MTVRDLPSTLAARASGVATTVRVLGRAGVIRPHGPRTLLDIGRLVVRWGTGPAGGFATLAAREPHQVGVVDELGELTWGELQRRSNSLARALAERGVREGDSVAVMCRNHRGFIDATIAIAKLGADILYLNTAFAGPQLVDVLEREAPSMVIHDEEFTGLLAGADLERRVLAWTDGDPEADGTRDTLEQLVSAYDEGDLQPPARHARIVILTSGTTGAPKGAPRKEAGIDAAVSLLSRMPLRAGWRTHIAAPLFHTWGFAHLALAMLLGSTVVLRRTFDPVEALRTTQAERCQSMVVIPVMLQRILALDPDGARGDRPLPRRGGRVVGLGAAGHPGAGVDGPLRRQPLQHLRLHRGGVRLDRHARGPAGRPDVGGQAAPRHRREDPRRRRAASCRGARRAGSSWATGCSSRATPTAGPRRSSRG